MKKYWLVLYPDTFLWLKNDDGIIYNSQNFRHFTFGCNGDIKKLCDTLVDPDSLYSVEVTDSLLDNQKVKQWIDKITGIEAGPLIEQNGKNKKLISYYPLLTIQNNVDNIRWKDSLNIGGEILKNLDELTFYLNGSPNGSELFFKQTYYPLRSTRTLNFELVKSFVKKCGNSWLKRITLVGNFINYKDLDQLQTWVMDNGYSIDFIQLAEDIETDITKYTWFTYERTSITIVVNDYSIFSKQFEFLENFSNKVKWKFPVTSITQFELVNSNLQEKGLEEYEIIPLYNGDNKDFFEENVYMTIDEFEDINFSKREVFANMALNIHAFGKLTVMPDGKIYANVNNAPLGSIGDPIYDLIYKEMTEGQSWLYVREMKPCCDCVYQWLCPSPGNYEKVIGKHNLCHVYV